MSVKEKIVKYNQLEKQMIRVKEEVDEAFGKEDKWKYQDGKLLSRIAELFERDEHQPYSFDFDITSEGLELVISEDCGVDVYITPEQIGSICEMLELNNPVIYNHSGDIALKFEILGE